MKKVIGYCRVSTEIQKEKDNSIKSQIKFITDYCQFNKLDLVNVFKDEGISGKISDRLGLNEMFEEIKRGTVTELMEYYAAHPPKGEIVIVVDGKPKK